MVSKGISADIRELRERYMQWMRDHGAMSREEIIVSVSETQATLLATFSRATDEAALRKPGEDEWCLRELAQHALFTERLIAQLIHHTARSSTPPAEALAGAGIGMMPEDDGKGYRDILSDLAAVNEDLLAAVRNLPDEPDREMKLAHPFFGPLNCLEWAGFQRVHDTDHIQHAEKILAAMAE